MTISRIGLAALFTLAIGPRAGAADPDYAYAWPLRTASDSAAWQVELTPEVYAAIGTQDLRDIEVVNADGAAVPTAIYHPPRPVGTAGTWIDLPLFALPPTVAQGADGDAAIRLHIERDPDGRLRHLDADIGTPASDTPLPPPSDWLLDASGVREAMDALRIEWDTGNADAIERFSISASEDLQQWRVLVADATVMELHQAGQRLQRHEIALHGARATYLRLRQINTGVPLPALRVGLRAIATATVQQPVRQWLAAQATGSDTHRRDPALPAYAGDQPIAFTYALPAALVATGLRVELADENSVVAAHASSRRGDVDDANAPWTMRSDFVAFRIREGSTQVANDEIPLSPGRRARDWRIELATPLQHAPRLEVAYVPDRFVFLAQGTGPYRLVAGSAHARRADYPVDTALASLRGQLGNAWQPPLAALGTRQVLRGAQALIVPAATPAPDWKTWLLWAVLVAAAALIGGLALSLLRRR